MVAGIENSTRTYSRSGDVDVLAAYRRRLQGVHTLDRTVENDLARRYAKGDEMAGDQMIEACLPFVLSIALEYRRWGIPLEDIVQQGNIGLLRAAKKFDATRECRLATYAAYWVRAEIRDYVVRSYRVVRLGTTKAERRALRAYRTTNIRDVDGLAEISGLAKERVEQLLPLLAAREASLDATVGDEPSRGERLAAALPSPEDDAMENAFSAAAKSSVAAALTGLSEREQLIVRSRLMSDDPLTLQELGVKLGVSKERVRQIEERVRQKLRGRLSSMREEWMH